MRRTPRPNARRRLRPTASPLEKDLTFRDGNRWRKFRNGAALWECNNQSMRYFGMIKMTTQNSDGSETVRYAMKTDANVRSAIRSLRFGEQPEGIDSIDQDEL